MDIVQKQLKVLRTRLDKYPVFQEAEVSDCNVLFMHVVVALPCFPESDNIMSLPCVHAGWHYAASFSFTFVNLLVDALTDLYADNCSIRALFF